MRLDRRSLRAALGVGWGVLALHAEPVAPRLAVVEAGSAQLVDGTRVAIGEGHGNWTLLATDPARRGAVFEDFTQLDGAIVEVGPSGELTRFEKSHEATSADPASLYRGHTLADVMGSDHDWLGRELLARPGDPSYAEVAACLAPLTKLATYSFVGTPDNPDKVGVAYGGRTANFDPAILVPAIRRIREQHRVLDGLVGGWLPVLRFIYPETDGAWTELLIFPPWRSDTGNPRIQPVWYRVCRVEHGTLRWARYFDSAVPAPPRTDTESAEVTRAFFADLVTAKARWEEALAPAMALRLPDARLERLARHSLARAIMTRVGAFPKYGVLDRNYGGAEHDGFQDTLNVDVTAMLEWGLFERARAYLDNYWAHFVRDDGSLLYRGPEIGQYGRMLTVVANYAERTGDTALLERHRVRIDAITRLLLARRAEAKRLPADAPAHGLLAGWSEADSCLEDEPARYVQPYFSNTCEAIRGFRDLGRVWQKTGRATGDAERAAWGETLVRESQALAVDLEQALERSRREGPEGAWIPAIAGASEPPHRAMQRDRVDPQYRAYRAYMEMLFSGVLARRDVETIARYRESHRDLILGVPTAYGYNTGELVGFLSYGHAFGLLQHDLVRDYLLELHSLAAHQYTRGTWTAPETRRIDPELEAAPYCVPAQLAVPLLVRWMLVFEDPATDALWLGKAVPRDWFLSGTPIIVSNAPVRGGRVSFTLAAAAEEREIRADLDLPNGEPGRTIKLRLRAPEGWRLQAVEIDGHPWTQFAADEETITLPTDRAGKLSVVARYR